MLKLRSVRAIPNVITYLSFVFPTTSNLILLIYYIVTQWILIASHARHMCQKCSVIFKNFFLIWGYTCHTLMFSVHMCPYLKKIPRQFHPEALWVLREFSTPSRSLFTTLQPGAQIIKILRSFLGNALYIIHKFYLSALLLHINFNYAKSHTPPSAQFA
jgi:hypothetical protein